MSALVKLALEAGPLVVFFIANAQAGLMTATAVFMVATIISLGLTYARERKIAVLPLVGGIFVLLFGGLTLWLEDELFIKVKPTLVNCLFGTILLAGLWAKRPLMKLLLSEAVSLTDEGWMILTRRWALFFFFLAALNEFIWRSFGTDFWAAFKLFGVMPITILFGLMQLPLFKRHATDPAS